MHALVVGGSVLALWAVAILIIVAVNRIANGPQRAVKPCPPCHCGRAIPAGAVAYCSITCRFDDDDHGPNGDDQ